MTQFLAVYTGTASVREKSGWDTMDQKQRQALETSGMQAWGDWMEAHKAAIVVPTPGQ
jgi:hypothetical protein